MIAQYALLIDVILYFVNLTFAVLQRGELLGWICTILIIWQTIVFVRFLKDL